MVMTIETLLVRNLSEIDSSHSSITFGIIIMLELKFDPYFYFSKSFFILNLFDRKVLNLL